MTRKEALTEWVIPTIRRTWNEKKCAEILKALEQEPCIQEKQANADKIDAVYIDGFKAGYSQARFDLEQEPCEDAISREAVCNIVEDIRDCISVEGYWAILERLKKLPSVHPECTEDYCPAAFKPVECDDCVSRDAVLEALYDHEYKKDIRKDIEALPSVQPKPTECDDCISRQAVLDILFYKSDNNSEVRLSKELRDRIKSLPPITPAEKVGHWIGIDEEPHEDWECDNCGFVIWADENIEKFHYCPNCGAKMQEVEE